MIRDEEIKRLIAYAKGHGLSVSLKPYEPKKRAYGTWEAHEGDFKGKIIVYYQKNESKLSLILTLIHEIAHHQYHLWLLCRFSDLVDVDAENLTKQERWQIYEYELKSTRYWLPIYESTSCKFPKYRLFLAMEFDVWKYEFYYLHNRYPNKDEARVKYRELKVKHLHGIEHV